MACRRPRAALAVAALALAALVLAALSAECRWCQQAEVQESSQADAYA